MSRYERMITITTLSFRLQHNTAIEGEVWVSGTSTTIDMQSATKNILFTVITTLSFRLQHNTAIEGEVWVSGTSTTIDMWSATENRQGVMTVGPMLM